MKFSNQHKKVEQLFHFIFTLGVTMFRDTGNSVFVRNGCGLIFLFNQIPVKLMCGIYSLEPLPSLGASMVVLYQYHHMQMKLAVVADFLQDLPQSVLQTQREGGIIMCIKINVG